MYKNEDIPTIINSHGPDTDVILIFGSFDEIEQFIDSALGTPGKKKALIARAQVKPMPKNGQ